MGEAFDITERPYSQEQLRNLGYLPEERGLYPKVKVSDQIIYLAQLRGMSRKDADQQLETWLNDSGTGVLRQEGRGAIQRNQQKIQFIAAVIHNPKIVILDEAFSGLDPVNVELLKSTVKELRDAGTRFYSPPTGWSMSRSYAAILRFCIDRIRVCKGI